VTDPQRRNGHACASVGCILVFDDGDRHVLRRSVAADSGKDAKASRFAARLSGATAQPNKPSDTLFLSASTTVRPIQSPQSGGLRLQPADTAGMNTRLLRAGPVTKSAAGAFVWIGREQSSWLASL
jgi:hypothetical protein